MNTSSKILFFSLLSFTFLLSGCDGKFRKGGLASAPKTEEQKTLYAVGVMFGSRLKQLGFSETEADMIVQGVRDSVLARPLVVESEDYSSKIQELFRKRRGRIVEVEKKQGAEFMEKFLKEEGFKKTESGLAYKITKPGTGKKPQKDATVTVHYVGKLINGEVFDSSRERNKPATFSLGQVIKGWGEGLQLVKAGGSIQLVIPSSLGYGDRGAPPKIPGGATLIFDVELLEIKAPKKKTTSRKKSLKSTKKKRKKKE